ncbi:LysR family transcriptional regulator [Salinicoccus bachuensis]|uniref:LysR family transcriptional regulator n=1 Tax=Salinicoccus bachuensis TaxID=3136731 RepID=A0ABZ3CIQ8_9STAP
MKTMNSYHAFIKALETGSFTKAADELGYTQSAISQMINSLEKELSTTLILRSRKGITLTPDGKEFLPYIRSIYNSQRELAEKSKEMEGLQERLIRIGAFSSVSCHWLPPLIKEFKQQYPTVRFELKQGNYTENAEWIKEGVVDFGFTDFQSMPNLTSIPLQEDEMLVILPPTHPLSKEERVPMEKLAKEPYILLDEGTAGNLLSAFQRSNFEPDIEYRVFDPYTIISMVEQGLGISILPKLLLTNNPYDVSARKISPSFVRTISLSYKDKRVLPIASRYFIDFIIERYRDI